MSAEAASTKTEPDLHDGRSDVERERDELRDEVRLLCSLIGGAVAVLSVSSGQP